MYNHSDRVDSKERDARLLQSGSARLGTPKRPVTVRVQNEKRKDEVVAVCKENGWAHDVQVDADRPEDTLELEQMQNPVKQLKSRKSVKRNDPCPCGSGKKYKKCCG